MQLEIKIERTTQPRPRPIDEKYGFGRHFSDHMFVADHSSDKGWHSSRVVPYQPLQLDPGAAVLHYGQSLFEGMKAFFGADDKIRLFRPEMNWKRLQEGAARLCMKAPPLEIFKEGLLALVETDRDWIPTKSGTALYLRPTLIANEPFLGVRPSDSYIYYVIASPVGGYYGENSEPVKIWVEREYSRAAPGGIGAAKAGGNYASSLLAATEAKKRGYAQVLWLDACEKKYVEEVGTMNVFFLIGDRLVTPPLGGTILPGVMRDSVIQLMEARKRPVDVRPVSFEELQTAHQSGELKEVFGSGTAASISPVGALGTESGLMVINDGKQGPLATELYGYFNDLQYGRIQDEMGWTLELPVRS
jgi:branched-chain amino acid aminotransferase